MGAWSQRLWGFSVLPFLLPFFILLLLSTRIFVSSSPESLGSRDPPWPPQSSGDQPLGPALRGEHGNSSGSCGSWAPLLLASSSAAAAGVTESSSSSSVTSAARTVEEYGPSPPVSSYDDLSSSAAATTLSATRGESTSPPPPLSRGHEFSSIADLSPTRPRRRRVVYARGREQATAHRTGPDPGRWQHKPFSWGDFSASIRTARLQLLVTAKMVDQGNGSLSVHFWHNATGREGNLSISLEPHVTPLRFPTRGPLASQQPRFHQQQQHRQHHHHQQQHRQHQHGQQQHHQYQQQPRHQQQWDENHQRHHEDEQHPKQQQHQHDQNNRQQQQQQWNEKQLQLKQDEQHDQHKQEQQQQHQHRYQQHPQQQQADSNESWDAGTFLCRVEYEKVDRALKRAPCAKPRVMVSPAAGSSPSPGRPGHGPPGVGSGTGGSCFHEQVQSHVSWICSKPISAFCIFIAFQGEDYRLAHKVCPDLNAARNPPRG